MGEPVFLGLGSNVDAERNLRAAFRLLSEQVTILTVSRVYQSIALAKDGHPLPERPAFLNAALLISTDLPPDRLKVDVLRPIEAQLGRQRETSDPVRHPIDIDILLYSDWVVDPETLTQAHVALPLADLSPDLVHPTAGKTLGEIAAGFRDKPGISVFDVDLLE
jgi:2-amino-4-hydroxy-6-hydroxymethyldihydropteridine diphosphokinase